MLKTLYESVISPETRKTLGEYYTPDWLASAMVEVTVTEPLATRLLDPGCGSGTFLFWCVRNFLAAADGAGMSNADALDALVSHVFGADVHPVAVALARVTYLLAIGSQRLNQDRGAISIPVYLGDSLQWGQRHGELSNGALRVPIGDKGTLWSKDLMFPESVVKDAGRFDRLVAAMADRAVVANAGRAKAINPILLHHGVSGGDAAMLRDTFQTMCDLHDSGRNHIWGYYVRNLVRPVWLSLPENRVKVLIGNPPWLAYRYMTSDVQEQFRAQCLDRNLWTGRKLATHQELAAYFVVRTSELYLQEGGHVAFVMPYATLSREQYEGFRSGKFGSPGVGSLTGRFEGAWDLDAVKPPPFPVPASVVFAEVGRNDAQSLTQSMVEVWSGRLLDPGALWSDAAQLLERHPAKQATDTHHGSTSDYAERFFQGATVVPRSLVCVEVLPPPALGLPTGTVKVRAARSRLEKEPWKSIRTLEGTVESAFVRDLVLGSTVVPFRTLTPWKAVVPWNGIALLDDDDTGMESFPGLADWWRAASDLWKQKRQAKSPPTLTSRLDYHHGLVNQFEVTGDRVVYTTSGSTLAAARLQDSADIVDSSLYWAVVNSSAEAHYLCAILNSSVLEEAVAPLQSKGLFGRRHFHKFVFKVPFPLFDPSDELHRKISDLGKRAEEISLELELPADTSFQRARKLVDEHLGADGVASQIEAAVGSLLDRGASSRTAPAAT